MEANASSANPIDDYVLDRIRYRVEHLIGKFGYTQSDRDDLTQELILHLLEALPQLDPARGSRKTFICRVLDRKVRSLIRYQTAQKRDSQRVQQSIHDVRPDHPTFDEQAQRKRLGRASSTSTEHIDLQLDVAEVLQRMPERLRRVAQVLSSHTPQQAARILGVKPTRLEELMCELRLYFEEAGITDF